MDAPRASRAGPSPADVADEVGKLTAGLGILTVQIFPFALPLLVLVVAPLVLVAVVGLLLAGILILPVWLLRLVMRPRSRRRGAAGSTAKVDSPARLSGLGPPRSPRWHARAR